MISSLKPIDRVKVPKSRFDFLLPFNTYELVYSSPVAKRGTFYSDYAEVIGHNGELFGQIEYKDEGEDSYYLVPSLLSGKEVANFYKEKIAELDHRYRLDILHAENKSKIDMESIKQMTQDIKNLESQRDELLKKVEDITNSNNTLEKSLNFYRDLCTVLEDYSTKNFWGKLTYSLFYSRNIENEFV